MSVGQSNGIRAGGWYAANVYPSAGCRAQHHDSGGAGRGNVREPRSRQCVHESGPGLLFQRNVSGGRDHTEERRGLRSFHAISAESGLSGKFVLPSESDGVPLGCVPSHSIAIDGIALGPGAQVLVPSMRCGSAGEHRLEVEVPVSTPAGPIGSTVAFTATLRQ